MKKSHLYIWHGKAVLYTDFIDTRLHQHHALQISVGHESSFRIKPSNKEWRSTRGIIIGADVPHQFETIAKTGYVLFVYLDPDGIEAKRLAMQILKEKDFVFFDGGPFIQLCNSISDNESNCYEMNAKTLRALNVFTNIHQRRADLDDRIDAAKIYIRENIRFKIRAGDISERIYLSKSRFLHLFKEQVGIPFRKYVLWTRLIYGLELVTSGMNLTEAAHEAGFSDLAHFSRSFVTMFGVNPSDIFNNQKIDITFCS